MEKRIGGKIKKLRESKRISTEIFYANTGINITRIENGNTNPTLKTIEKISKYLKIPIQYILEED